jgi:hypothetical protein
VDPSKNQPNLKRFASIFSVFFPPSEDNDAKNLFVFQKWNRLCKMNQEFETELQVYFFDSETLSPQSSKQRRSLLKSCLSELNPDVLAKIKRPEKQSTSEKRSKRKKTHSNWMSGIGGPIIVGLITVILGAFGAFAVSRMIGSRDSTPVTDSTSSGGKEDQSTQQPKLQESAKVTQSATPAGPKDPSASKSTESLPVEKPIVTVSPTKTEPSLGPVLPQGGGAKANNAFADKLKQCEEKWKTAIDKFLVIYKFLKKELEGEMNRAIKNLVNVYTDPKLVISTEVVARLTNRLSCTCEIYQKIASDNQSKMARDILADWKKMKENYNFLAMNPRNYLLIKKSKNSEDNFVPDRLLKANALCGELKTQGAKDALREAVKKSLIDFLPDKLALDAKIEVIPMEGGAQIPVFRNTVTWKQKGDSLARQLTNDPAEPNECSSGDEIQWIYNRKSVTVKPLRTSQDAYNYTQARKELVDKGFNLQGISGLSKLVLADNRNEQAKNWNNFDWFKATTGIPKPSIYNRVKIVVDALNNPALSHLFPKGEKTPMATSP